MKVTVTNTAFKQDGKLHKEGSVITVDPADVLRYPDILIPVKTESTNKVADKSSDKQKTSKNKTK